MITPDERTLAREKALEKHKKRRAITIAKIRRKRKVDTYIKSRVYRILSVSFLLVFLFAFDKRESNNRFDKQLISHTNTIDYMGELISDLSHSNLLDINMKLARAYDSVQIVVFVYHRRFMSDQKTIQHLMSRAPKKIRQKIIADTNLVLPAYMQDDPEVEEFGIDSIYEFEDSVEYYEVDSLGNLN